LTQASGNSWVTSAGLAANCVNTSVRYAHRFNEIVRRVSALFARAAVIEAAVAAARKRVDALTQAVLAKAFRGELVPTEADLARRENRPYEPAADLLARLRPPATTAIAKPKGTRKPKGTPAP